jgi:hypothetical protein
MREVNMSSWVPDRPDRPRTSARKRIAVAVAVIFGLGITNILTAGIEYQSGLEYGRDTAQGDCWKRFGIWPVPKDVYLGKPSSDPNVTEAERVCVDLGH